MCTHLASVQCDAVSLISNRGKIKINYRRSNDSDHTATCTISNTFRFSYKKKQRERGALDVLWHDYEKFTLLMPALLSLRGITRWRRSMITG